MSLRRDHVAGGVLLAAALAVLAISRDLEIGTLASPGAGMLPHLAIGFVALFAAMLLIGARNSPPLATLDWSDLGHALRVAAIGTIATALYTTLGFLMTMGLMLLVLLLGVERVPPRNALLFSIGVTVGIYVLLARLLKSPLPTGPLGIFGL